MEPSRARALRTATEAQIESAELALESEVTAGYLQVLRAQEEVVLARQRGDRARFNLRLAQGLADVGQGTQLDAMQAELQVGRADVATLQAENTLETARLRLLQSLGTEVSLDADVTLTTSFELSEPVWETEALYSLALTSNPTLRARRSTVSASSVGVEIARSAYYPTLSLTAGMGGFTRQASDPGFLVGQARASVADQVASCEFQNELFRRLANPLPVQDCTRFRFTDEMRQRIISANDAFPFSFTSQPASASLTVSLPIFQGLSRQRDLEAARIQREDAEQQVREQELALRADIAIDLAAVRTAYRSALLEEQNQNYADEQLRLAQERYRLGGINFVELVDAETVKAEADHLRTAAVYGYHDAITSLEAVVGARLRQP